MGNDKSKPADSTASKDSHPTTHHDSRTEKAFDRLSPNGEPLTYQTLSAVFGEDLAESLWKFLADTESKEGVLSKSQFSKNVARLMGNSNDIYVLICQPIYHLIKVCSEAAGANAVEGDQSFITALAKEMTSSSGTTRDIVTWMHQEMPKLCDAVQALVLHKCLDYELPSVDYSSDILTPLQMWYAQCCLPPTFFPAKDKAHSSVQWTPLYTSASQGISVNRFEANVFDYKGPTVSIFQLDDKRTVVLATDQEWRHGSSRFGGAATTFLEVRPSLKRIEASSSIYCNFKLRSAVFGLSFQKVMEIDKEMSNVLAIEVWGCAPASTLLEQQKQKQWQGQQAERHKKVPLPGNWDDNPDKTLLEMAGFQFSNERKLMEMEGCRK